jgi:hypothetical protein
MQDEAEDTMEREMQCRMEWKRVSDLRAVQERERVDDIYYYVELSLPLGLDRSR